MPYDAGTAERVPRLLAPHDVVEERMVGGGLSFTVGGRMVCGVTATALAVRVGADAVPGLLAEPHLGPMVLDGRQVRAFEPAGYAATPTSPAGCSVVSPWPQACTEGGADLRSAGRGPMAARRGR